jgi:hypothetical protein
MTMSEIVFSVQKSPEGGYVAVAVDHNIFTQADTVDELQLNVRDAVRCHFDGGETLPVIRLVEGPPPMRRFGSAKGEFTVPDDFNDPLPKGN